MLKSLQDKVANFAESYYDSGSFQARKLSNLFRGAQFSAWITRHTSKPVNLVAIESFVAVSLVVYYFFLMLPQVQTPRPYDGNSSNASLFTHFSRIYSVGDELGIVLMGFDPLVQMQASTALQLG